MLQWNALLSTECSLEARLVHGSSMRQLRVLKGWLRRTMVRRPKTPKKPCHVYFRSTRAGNTHRLFDGLDAGEVKRSRKGRETLLKKGQARIYHRPELSWQLPIGANAEHAVSSKLARALKDRCSVVWSSATVKLESSPERVVST